MVKYLKLYKLIIIKVTETNKQTNKHTHRQTNGQTNKTQTCCNNRHSRQLQKIADRTTTLTEIPNREGSDIPPPGDESLLPPSLSRFSEQGQEYIHYTEYVECL